MIRMPHRTFPPIARTVLVLAIAVIVAGCASTSRLPPTSDVPPAEVEEKIDPFAFAYYSNGTIYFLDGRFEDAAAEWSKALKYDPDSREIRMSLAEAYFRLRKFDRAVATAEAVTPRTADVWGFLGKAYRFTGHVGPASAAYREVIRLDTANVEAYWYLARLAVRQGRLDAAIEHLESVTQWRKSSPVFNELADLYLKRGRKKDAERTLLRSLGHDDTEGNRQAYINLTRLYESIGEFEKGAEALAPLIESSPEDMAARKQRTTLLLRAGKPHEAIAAIEKILAIHPRDPERLRLGIIYYNLDSLDAADSLFTVLDTEQADDYLVPYYLGRISNDREEFDAARAQFHRSIAVNDTIPDAWIQLANTWADQDSLGAVMRIGREASAVLVDPKPMAYFVGVTLSRAELYDSAAAWLTQAIDDDNPDIRALFALASAYERGGQFDSSETRFRQLLAIEPDNHVALNYLAYMYAEKGVNLDDALMMVEKALEAEPKNGAYLDTYGWVLFKLGRLDDAETQIRRALEAMTEDSVIWEHLGDILEQLGRPSEARDNWARALEMNPDNDLLRTKLKGE